MGTWGTGIFQSDYALDVKDTTPRSVTAQTAASRGAMSRNIDGTVAQVENKDKK